MKKVDKKRQTFAVVRFSVLACTLAAGLALSAGCTGADYQEPAHLDLSPSDGETSGVDVEGPSTVSSALNYCEPAPSRHHASLAEDVFERLINAEPCDASNSTLSSEPDMGPIPVHATEMSSYRPQMDPLIGYAYGRRVEGGMVEVYVELWHESRVVPVILERLYDGEGRLLAETRRSGSSVYHVVDNTWDGDRLVAATVDDSRGTTEYTYDYDSEGRLTYASGNVEGTVQEARWSYSETAIELTQLLDDQTFATTTYGFDDEGQLRSRTLTQAGHNTTSLRLFDGQYFDPYWHYEEPASGDCAALPSEPTWGYPQAEAEYDLGWPVDDRPNGIGWAYEYFGYEANYGTHGYWGHTGVLSRYNDFYRSGALTVQTTYDATGRMLTEQIAHCEEGAACDPSVTRTRDYDAQGMTSDRLTTSREGTSQTIEIAFEREQGHLTRRDTLVDGLLVRSHGWQRDEEGRTTLHTLEADRGVELDVFTPGAWVDTSAASGLEPTSHYQVTFTGESYSVQGSRVREHVVDGVPQQADRLEWDQDTTGSGIAGRPVNIEMRSEVGNPGIPRVVATDADGEIALIAEGSYWYPTNVSVLYSQEGLYVGQGVFTNTADVWLEAQFCE